jgi:hypothetical protein
MVNNFVGRPGAGRRGARRNRRRCCDGPFPLLFAHKGSYGALLFTGYASKRIGGAGAFDNAPPIAVLSRWRACSSVSTGPLLAAELENGNAPKFWGRFDVRTVTFDAPI